MTVVGTSKPCRTGACIACVYSSALCSCPHHLDGAARLSEDGPVPAPTIQIPNPLFEAEVERRATRLCAGAEPHEISDRDGCLIHESEARRQLYGQWLAGGQSEVA